MLTDSELAEQVARHHVVLPLDLRFQQAAHRKQPLLPVSAIQTTSLRYGHIETHADSDGVIRGAQLYSSGLPHLALLVSEQSISPSAQNYRRFAMVNSKTGFRTITLSEVLSDAFPIATLKDKYLLLGASSPNLVSQYPTISSNSNNQLNTQPKRQLSSALEIHASLLNALLQDKLINQPSAAWGYAISLVCLLAVLIGLLVLSPVAEMMLTISLIALMLLTSFGLLKFFNIWLDPLPVALAMLLVKPVWAWRRMEMISHCMQQNILILAGSDEAHKQTAMPQALSSRSVFLRYTQILSEAIQSVNERLHFLSLVISEIPEAVLIADEHGRIMRHNQKMSAIFEDEMLKKGNLMANLFAHLEVFSDEQISALLHRPYSEERFAALDKNGALREYRMRVLPLPFSKLNYWQLMMMVDITDLVNLQKQRDRTLAILTHDMRTPVASILAVCRHEDVSVVGQREQVAKIRKHSHFLLSMMDDFILSIRAESDQYSMQETLIETLLDEAIYQVRDLMQSRQMRVVYAPAEPIFLEVDARLMTRVIVNLLANAVRYGAHGSEVHLLTEVMQQSGNQNMLVLTIANQVGSPSDASRQTPENKGFGMGLDFIQTVIAKHHGYFKQSISHQEGEQASVQIYLPCLKSDLVTEVSTSD
ncbi:MAG: CHASE2 domain-containing protein [Candidatus Methylopumilus sp.]